MQFPPFIGGDSFDGYIEPPDESPLSPSQKNLCDRFVAEYLTDFDWLEATMRLGYPESMAKGHALDFKNNPYVLRRINEAQRAQPHNEEAIFEQTKRQVINALLKESQFNGPGSSHGARVGALSKLSSILAMDAPTKTESTVTHEGGTTLEHTFNYESLDKEDLGMMRALLTKQAKKVEEAKEEEAKDS